MFEMQLVREGIPIGPNSNVVALWNQMVLRGISKGMRSYRISQQADSVEEEMLVGSEWQSVVAMWPHEVAELYDLIVGDHVSLYRRLLSRLRGHRVPMSWSGFIEIQFPRITISITADLLAFSGGRFLAFEFSISAEELAMIGLP